MPAGLKRRLLRAGGWNLAKRLIKPIPIVGSVFAVGLAAHEVKRKGLLRGAIHVGLDATPVVGTIKNVVEIFTGDIIADKKTGDKTAPVFDLHNVTSDEHVRQLQAHERTGT